MREYSLLYLSHHNIRVYIPPHIGLKKIADLIFRKLAKFFCALLTSGSFPESLRIAIVTPIPKGSTPDQFLLEYRPFSITPIISKFFEKLIARKLYKFANAEEILPQTQFDFRKGLVLLTHNLQAL